MQTLDIFDMVFDASNFERSGHDRMDDALYIGGLSISSWRR